jgi:hypothetical protein
LTVTKPLACPKRRYLVKAPESSCGVDVYNLFNNLNLDPNQLSNNVGSSNFGTITGGLAARVVALGARFSF